MLKIAENQKDALEGFVREQMYENTPNVFDFKCLSCNKKVGMWEQSKHKKTCLENNKVKEKE